MIMTTIRLTSSELGIFEVPDKNLIGVFSSSCSTKDLSDEEISNKFDSPINLSPIRDLARGKKQVLLVCDDNTRPTPISRLLPFVIDELSKANIEDRRIKILIGLGTHRPMDSNEIIKKFGKDISERYEIINHTWDDDKQLVRLESTGNGFEIIINRLVLESDFIVSMGNIIPHATAGFSGGGKTIMPGVCGNATIADTHWKALEYPMKEILGVLNNPVRLSIRNVCRKIELNCIVDSVIAGGKLVDIVVGEGETAHAIGARKSREIYGVEIREKADIVVAEAFPMDIDLRQAIKAICSADVIVRGGGVIILAAGCPEGISPQFPDFEKYGFSNPEWLYREVEEGRFDNKLLAYTLVAIGRIISEGVKCILVSPNIDKERKESMGFIHAEDLSMAMECAFKIAGRSARTAILKNAGELLPILVEDRYAEKAS